MPAERTPGRIAYDAYGDDRNWKTATGGDMPRWDDQRHELRDAWEAAAEAVIIAQRELKAWRIDDEYATTVAALTGEEAATWYASDNTIARSRLLAVPIEVDAGELLGMDEEGSALIAGELLAKCTSWPALLSQDEV